MASIGVIGVIVGTFALLRGSIPRLKIANRKVAGAVIAVSLLVMSLGAPLPDLPHEVGDSPPGGEVIEQAPSGSQSEPEVVSEAPKPEPIPDPIVYSGVGDDVIRIEMPEEGPVMLYIKGNSQNRHFAVVGFDANDNRTNLFVNTTDPYEGITLDPSGTTAILEIKSVGSWTIESRSVRSARVIKTPGSIKGTGDEVVLIEGVCSLATVRGNPSGRHFAVLGYNPGLNLMVNTTDVYDGKVKVARDTFLLEITAEGKWEISLE